jgi:hypothetical protein
MLLRSGCMQLVGFISLFPYKFVVFFKVFRHYLNLAGDGDLVYPDVDQAHHVGRARDQNLSRMLWTFTACCLVLFWICLFSLHDDDAVVIFHVGFFSGSRCFQS